MAIAQSKKESIWVQYRKHSGLLIMLLPCMAFFVLFMYVPMVSMIVGFKDYVVSDGILGSRWTGLDQRGLRTPGWRCSRAARGPPGWGFGS